MQSQDMLHKLPKSAFAYAAGLITATVGLLVLIGWQFDIGILKSILPDAVPMRPNAAVAFVLSGLALIFLQKSDNISRALVRFFVTIIIIVGFLTLCEYLAGWDLGIDEILISVPRDIIGKPDPSRMAPTAALNFMLLGFAFIVLTFKKFRNRFIVMFCVTFSITVSVIGLVGYATGLLEITGIGADDYTKMAVHAASTFIILSIGILLTAHERWRTPITIEQRLLVGLTTTATIIIFISFLSITNLQSLIRTHERIEHTHEIKDQLNELLNRVKLVQTHERSFVLTGESSHAKELQAEIHALPGLLKDVNLLTIDNPRWQNVLVVIEALVKEHVEFYEQVYHAGETRAISLLGTGKGIMLTDSILAHIYQVLEEENRILLKSNEDESKRAERMALIIYLSLIAQVLLFVFIFFMVSMDVIGRRKAKESLQKLNEELEDRVRQRTVAVRCANARLEIAQRVAHMGFLDWDLRTNNIYWSDEVCRMYGLEPGENMQTLESTVALVHPEDRDFAQKQIEMAVQGVKDYDIDHRILRLDGKVFWVRAQAELIRDDGGTPVSLLGTVVDITDRKKGEEELRQQRELLNDILVTIPNSIWAAAPNGEFHFLSPATEQIYGRPLAELRQNPTFWLESVHPEDRLEVERQSQSLITSGVKDITYRLLRPDGSVIWIHDRAQIVKDENDQMVRLIGIGTDVTERKQAEERIKASLKEKEVLLQEIHHRVKNNLQVVSSLLSMQSRAAKDKVTIEMLSESRDRINAMALIHAQLYESTNLLEINIKGFVDGLIGQLFQSYPVKDIKITPIVHVVDYTLPITMAVPIGLILNELLTNAIKHAFIESKQGEIKVCFDVSEKGNIRLTVGDDGVGLPRGFDINKSETLGLKLVKILVEDQLQGNIEINSKKGTTFKVEFEI